MTVIRKLVAFLRSDRGFFLIILIWFFAIVLFVAWQSAHYAPPQSAPEAAACRSIDLLPSIRLQAGEGERVFAIQIQGEGRKLSVREWYLMVYRSHRRAGLIGMALERCPQRHVAAVWQFKNDKDGFTWWGDPTRRWLGRGPTVPRRAVLGKTYQTPVIWHDRWGEAEPDICEYGVYEEPHSVYLIRYRFKSGREWTLFLSPPRKLPIGFCVVEP